MKNKKIITLLVFVLTFVVSTCFVFANAYDYGYIGSLFIEAENDINPGQTSAWAETRSSYQYTDTYVTATFYWHNNNTQTYGSDPISAGKAGYVTVSPNSASGKYFYRVVSSHNAWYGSGSLSFSNLTTEAP